MVSQKDVAKRAGVSSATVSRVVSNSPLVKEPTRKKVLAAIRELGYQPDETARRLRAHSTSRVIGLIVSDIQNPHFNAVVRGLEDFAYENQMNIILCNTDEQVERQQYYLDLMQSERAVGLIINPTDYENDGQRLDKLRQAGTQVVLIDGNVKGYSFDVIQSDDQRGADDAVSYLIGLGYVRIATITGRLNTASGRNRLAGYKRALQRAGIPFEDRLCKTGDFTFEGGYAAMKAFLELDPRPQAVFSANNLMTLGALSALNESGVQVPRDLGIVGYDDIPWAEALCPPLTVVAQSPYEIGREAGRLLLRRLEEPDAPYLNINPQTRLIIRRSCICSPSVSNGQKVRLE